MQCSCRFLFSRPPSDSKDCLASLNPHQGFLLITCCESMASKLWNSMQKFYSCMDAVCCYQLRRGGCCIIAWRGQRLHTPNLKCQCRLLSVVEVQQEQEYERAGFLRRDQGCVTGNLSFSQILAAGVKSSLQKPKSFHTPATKAGAVTNDSYMRYKSYLNCKNY